MTKLMLRNRNRFQTFKKHYKMFKTHHGWMYMPLLLAGLAGFGFASGQHVHADSTQNGHVENQNTQAKADNIQSEGTAQNNQNENSQNSNQNKSDQNNAGLVTNWQVKEPSVDQRANVNIQYQDEKLEH